MLHIIATIVPVMETFYLNQMRRSAEVRVVAISGGRMARKKLMDLGIVPGERLKVAQNDGSGPLIVEHHGSRVVVGTGLAGKVRVAEI